MSDDKPSWNFVRTNHGTPKVGAVDLISKEKPDFLHFFPESNAVGNLEVGLICEYHTRRPITEGERVNREYFYLFTGRQRLQIVLLSIPAIEAQEDNEQYN